MKKISSIGVFSRYISEWWRHRIIPVGIPPFFFVNPGEMKHFALTFSLGSRESVGGLGGNHYPSKTLGSFRKEEPQLRLLSQNHQVHTREGGNPSWEWSRYFPFFTHRETILICYHRSWLFRWDVQGRESRSSVFLSHRSSAFSLFGSSIQFHPLIQGFYVIYPLIYLGTGLFLFGRAEIDLIWTHDDLGLPQGIQVEA